MCGLMCVCVCVSVWYLALVSLRAVGGHGEDVAALSPVDGRLDALQQRVRELEGARVRHVGVDHEGRQRAWRGAQAEVRTHTTSHTWLMDRRRRRGRTHEIGRAHV